MSSIKIKICGLKEPSNISDVSNLHPDFIGFIFYSKSRRFIEHPIPASMLSTIPENVKRVGVFVNEKNERIIQVCERYNLKHVQLHGEESSQECQMLGEKGLKVIKAIPVQESKDLTMIHQYIDSVDFILLDAKGEQRGGNGIPFDWTILEGKSFNIPIILSGGINLSMIPEIIKLKDQGKIDIYGIDVNSGFEISPGNKDLMLVENAIQLLRTKQR